jgi:hypothetical protein
MNRALVRQILAAVLVFGPVSQAAAQPPTSTALAAPSAANSTADVTASPTSAEVDPTPVAPATSASAAPSGTPANNAPTPDHAVVATSVSAQPVSTTEPSLATTEAAPDATPSKLETTEAPTPNDGPMIDLAEEHTTAAPSAYQELGLSARRASASVFSALPGDQNATTIGGYAQFNLTSTRRGFDGKFDTQATVRRLVLLLSHHITDSIAAYTELEWENAIACATCSGSVEIEQAYVDWQILGDALTLRSGLVLIPLGLLNLWHEPPIFHGVDRPQFDQTVIPTTWRELGAGITGLLRDNLEYQLYVTTTVVPNLLGPNGLVGGRQLGSNSLAQALAVSGRVDYEPLLGLSLSGAVFASDAGGNGDYYNADGGAVDFTFPIWGGSLTARLNRRGWEARAVGAAFWLPEAGALMNARREDGGLLFPNSDRTGAVPTRMQGGLIEVAYDVLHLADLSHQLLPFVRAETYDTQAAVPQDFRPNKALSVQEWTFGLTYRPIRQLVFKADAQLRDRLAGLDELQLNAGMGYML